MISWTDFDPVCPTHKCITQSQRVKDNEEIPQLGNASRSLLMWEVLSGITWMMPSPTQSANKCMNKKESGLRLWNMVVQSTLCKKNLFQSKNIERGEIRGKHGKSKNTLRQEIEKKIKIKSSPIYINYIPTVIFEEKKDLRVVHQTGGKWFIHGPKHHKEKQLQSLELPCWLS